MVKHKHHFGQVVQGYYILMNGTRHVPHGTMAQRKEIEVLKMTHRPDQEFAMRGKENIPLNLRGLDSYACSYILYLDFTWSLASP